MIRISRKPWEEPGFDIYSQPTYKKLRLGYHNHKGEFVPPELTRGWEWDYYNTRVCIYNLDLLESFFRNRQQPEKHLENVQAYLDNQQQSKRGRKLNKLSGEIA
jgi:hypothetical protein